MSRGKAGKRLCARPDGSPKRVYKTYDAAEAARVSLEQSTGTFGLRSYRCKRCRRGFHVGHTNRFTRRP